MGKPKFHLFTEGQKNKLMTKQTNQVSIKVQHMKEHNHDGKHQQQINTYQNYKITEIYCRFCDREIKIDTVVKPVSNSKSVNIEKFKKISFLLDSHLYHLHCAIRLNIVDLEDVPSQYLTYVPRSYEAYGLKVPKKYFTLKREKKITTLEDYIYRFNQKEQAILCPIPQ